MKQNSDNTKGNLIGQIKLP